MDFKIGYTVKPKEITQQNKVIFEEFSEKGIFRDVIPTEDECKGYGFIYDNSNCWVLANNTDFIKIDNVIEAGKRNNYYKNTDDCLFAGIDNIIFADCNNDLVVGNNNEVSNGIDNTIISGTKGEANYNNSQVVAGNEVDDILGERQSILVLAGADTTNSSYTRAYLNDDGVSSLNVKDNSIMAYTAHTIGVRTGGTQEGNKGDFRYWIERGAVVSRGGVLTLDRTREIVATDGTVTGWSVSSITDGTDFYIKVKGRNNSDIKWTVRIEITEMRTGIAL